LSTSSLRTAIPSQSSPRSKIGAALVPRAMSAALAATSIPVRGANSMNTPGEIVSDAITATLRFAT